MYTMKTLSKRKRQTVDKLKPGPAIKGMDISCGACGHKRQQLEVGPKWQCPCCKRAYSKTTSKSGYTEKEIKRKNSTFFKKRIAEQENNKLKGKKNISAITGAAGYMAFLSGLSSACTKTASNPILLAIGGTIIIASMLYFASSFLG